MRKSSIITIPNLLSLIRLLMIPVFVVLYRNQNYVGTALVLLLSGATDVVDGFIARKFGQISDLGKVLDPIADKVTQAVMLLCLLGSHRSMLLLFIMLCIKEAFTGISGIVVIKRTGLVPGAKWHGKLTTLFLYGLMILHVLWQDIPMVTSNVLIAACLTMMIISLVLYARDNIKAIMRAK